LSPSISGDSRLITGERIPSGRELDLRDLLENQRRDRERLGGTPAEQSRLYELLHEGAGERRQGETSDLYQKIVGAGDKLSGSADKLSGAGDKLSGAGDKLRLPGKDWT